MNTRAHPDEVQQWVELLRHTVESATGTGGTVRARGSRPATGDPLEEVLERLMQASAEVRREVIEALGEQGDEVAVEVLGRLAQREPQVECRLLIVGALSRAQVPEGIETLMELSRNDLREEVRAEAIRQLGERALAAWPTLGVRTRGAVRVRGAARVRGVTPSKSAGLSPEANAILSLLDRIRFGDTSTLVRGVADETLGRLDE